MRISEKYSYSKYRNGSTPTGSGKIFVSDKVKYQINPVFHLPAKFFGNILIVLGIIFLFWILFYSKYFMISEVIVEGNSLVETELISSTCGSEDNIFRFDIFAAKKQIMNVAPIIDDVEIYRGIPNALKIVVLEKKPAIVWQNGTNDFYLIDELGIAAKRINSNEFPELIRVVDRKNLKVEVGKRIVSPEFIKFSREVSEKFYDSANVKLTGYYVDETTIDLYVQTESGFFVKFDTSRKVEKQLEDLKKIIIAYRPNIHEYVDVRINGWAYYK